MKKIINLKCPNCGAVLSIEEERDYLFCQYCGAKLVLDNENEYIYRHIDEAKLKQAETEQIIKIKKLEMAEKKAEDLKNVRKMKIKITFVGFLLFIICWIIGSNSGDKEHWSYMVSLVVMVGIMWMWIGGDIFNDKE